MDRTSRTLHAQLDGILLIVALIIILIVVEFILPLVTGKKTENDVDEHVEKMPETENQT